MTEKNKKADSFIQAMAVGTTAFDRPGLSVPPPPAHAHKRLESERSLDRPISRREKLDSEAKFEKRLSELREQYAPFLRTLSPALPRQRHQKPLDQFEFRFEEDADLRDAQRPYAQEGAWEAVTIPDYRGPHGRWAAYYRTRFTPDAELFSQQHAWLIFRGVDYKAQVFLNGHYIGSHEGFFAEFSFDVTAQLRRDAENILLVRVENDAIQMGNHSWRSERGWSKEVWPSANYDGDKVYGATGLGWNAPEGWTHCPPGGGIWQPVFLESRPKVFVNDIYLRPDIDHDAVDVWLDVYNSVAVDPDSNVPVCAELSIYPHNFDGQSVENVKIELQDAGPRLNEYRTRIPLKDFRLWTLDEPWLYSMQVRLSQTEAGVDDYAAATFGMRKFHQDDDTSTLSARREKDVADRLGTFYLNNEPIILRGSNTMGHMQRAVYENDQAQLIDDVLIAKMANLNFFRLTQRPVQREIYEICDALGMMLQVDLPAFAGLRKSCIEETCRQAGEMERLIRSHPSVVVISFLNEPMSGYYDQRPHRLVDRATLEDVFEIAMRLVHMYNPDRVIKCVDGDYDPPVRHGMPDHHCYSTAHDNHGVPFGRLHAGQLFTIKDGWKCGVGEYGTEGFDTWDVMQKYYPPNWLPESLDAPWTPDVVPTLQAWGWHYQWHDKQETLRQWMRASWQQQTWGVRFETEALRRRADVIISTTLHLLINAWPNGWMKSLVTVDRTPLPAFYAFADALTPIAVNAVTNRHAVYGGEPLDMELWLLNDTNNAPEGLVIEYWVRPSMETELLNQNDAALIDGHGADGGEEPPLFIQKVDAIVPTMGSLHQGTVSWETPLVKARRQLEFGCTLKDANGHVLHDHAVRLEVFPEPDRTLLAGRRIAVLGAPGGDADALARRFGATDIDYAVTGESELVIADSPEAVERSLDALETFFATGGAALFLEAPVDTAWQLSAGTVTVKKAPGPVHFLSRKTEHRAVADCHPFDFFMWFNREAGHIDHICKTYLEGADLTPLLLTGSGLWYSERRELPAAAELRCDKGTAIFDQTCVVSFLDGEPRAEIYLYHVLQYLLEQGE